MKIVECSACGSKELELSEGMLVCIYCRTRFLPDASTGGNFDVFEKKTGFDVVLEDGGKLKIAVIKVVRELTNTSLRQAKDLVEGAPQTIMSQVTLDAANQAKQRLEGEGASVTVR